MKQTSAVWFWFWSVEKLLSHAGNDSISVSLRNPWLNLFVFFLLLTLATPTLTLLLSGGGNKAAGYGLPGTISPAHYPLYSLPPLGGFQPGQTAQFHYPLYSLSPSGGRVRVGGLQTMSRASGIKFSSKVLFGFNQKFHNLLLILHQVKKHIFAAVCSW